MSERVIGTGTRGMQEMFSALQPRQIRPVWLLAAGSILIFLAPVWAQDSPCRPPLPDWLLPGEENYSSLKQKQTDAYDRLHYIPFGSSEPNSYLSVGGQVRQWYETFRTPPFGLGPKDENGYLLQRYMVHFDAHFGENVRAFVDLKGNLENGRIGGPRPDIDEDRGDVHQAFVDVTLARPAGGTVTLRVGRQEMVYGAGRFVDMREGPNVRRSFDGAKLTYCSANWRVDAFASKPVSNPGGGFNDVPAHGKSFWGVYATRALPVWKKASLDVYYFGFDQKTSLYARGAGREQRQTVGARFTGELRSWGHDYEVIGQLGRFSSGGIRAWGASSDTGYRFLDRRWKPRLA